jgi:carbon monoxide dehydrogenase subunit G
MKLRTSFPITAPPAVLAALADPAQVAAALPGCRSVEAGDDGGLAVVLDLSVASVQGLWSGTVTLVDADTVSIAGSGAPGTVGFTARADGDRTRLTVEGEVSGPLATVGTMVLAAAIRRLADTLLANLASASAPSASAHSATRPDASPDAGAAIRQRGLAGAVAAAAVVTGAVVVVRWRRRRSAR